MSPLLVQVGLYLGFLGAGALIRHVWQPKTRVTPVPASPAVPPPAPSGGVPPGPFKGILANVLQKAEARLQQQLELWAEQAAANVLNQTAQPGGPAPDPTPPK